MRMLIGGRDGRDLVPMKDSGNEAKVSVSWPALGVPMVVAPWPLDSSGP